jgi:hypothetical protein
MGNKVHALSDATHRSGELVRLVEWMATRDGVVCPVEERSIELARSIHNDVTLEVATDNLIAYLQKGGAEASRYANQLAAPLGLRLLAIEVEDIDEEEVSEKVIPITGRRTPNGAA